MQDVIAILGLAAAMVVWFLLQRETGHLSPERDDCPPEVVVPEGGCGSCSVPCGVVDPLA
jgi:hypothetical protein